MHSFTVSRHGSQRARERVGWTGATTERMMPRVFLAGADRWTAPAPLQRFISAVAAKQSGCIPKIYGEHLFIFGAEGNEAYELITVYPLPPDLRRVMRGQKRFPKPTDRGPAMPLNVSTLLAEHAGG